MLSRPEAVAVLRTRLPDLPDQVADQLADALGDLPLAVAQAGAFLSEAGMAAEEYLRLLRTRAADVLGRGVPAGYPRPLAVSLTLAFEQLSADAPGGVQLLGLAAQLAAEPVPLNLFSAHSELLPEPLASVAADPLALAELKGVLRGRGLIRVTPDSLQLAHRLIATLVNTQPAVNVAESRQLAGRLLSAAVPPDPWRNPPVWPVWRALLPHVLALLDQEQDIAGFEDDASWLLDRAATYLQTRGDPRSARPLFDRAYQLNLQRLGEDHPNTLTAASNLAVVLHALGELAAARQLDQDTYDRRRRVLGEDHPHTLDSANNLANDLRELGEHAAARQLDQDTYDRFRRLLGENHPDTLISANNLAVDLRTLGEHAAARQLDQDTYDRFRRLLGEDHPHTLISANNLAVDLRALGEHATAGEVQRWIDAHPAPEQG